MNWQQRKKIAEDSYRASNNHFAVDVRRLRSDIFEDDRIPLDANRSDSIEVFNTRGQSIGKMGVRTIPSRNVGEKKTRGGRGHRLFIQCPACGYNAPRLIPVGRLHQHYGYAHPEV